MNLQNVNNELEELLDGVVLGKPLLRNYGTHFTILVKDADDCFCVRIKVWTELGWRFPEPTKTFLEQQGDGIAVLGAYKFFGVSKIIVDFSSKLEKPRYWELSL